MMSEKIPCHVKICPNGCVHIQLGAVTLNLHKDDFMEFSSVIESAARQVDAPPANLRSLTKFRLLRRRQD